MTLIPEFFSHNFPISKNVTRMELNWILRLLIVFQTQHLLPGWELDGCQRPDVRIRLRLQDDLDEEPAQVPQIPDPGAGRHGAGGLQHSGRWDPAGTAANTHRWVEGVGGMVLEGYNIVGDGTPQALLPILTGGWRVVGWDPTGTATYTHRWVEGVGGMVLEGYNIVGDWTPQALLPILTGGWRVMRLEGIKVRSWIGWVLRVIILWPTPCWNTTYQQFFWCRHLFTIEVKVTLRLSFPPQVRRSLSCLRRGEATRARRAWTRTRGSGRRPESRATWRSGARTAPHSEPSRTGC